MGFAPPVGASRCGTGPQSGAVSLAAALTSEFGPAGGRSLGIFNCRRIAGPTSPWSLHAEGRALDFGVPAPPHDLGDLVVDVLLRVTDQSLQRIIWDHTLYDLVSPLGRGYFGSNPHTDHLHIELSWPAARGELACELPDDHDGEDDPMPVLIVAYKGAQWAVSPDLTSRVGLSQTVDVQALTRLNGGRSYVSAALSEALMARIPPVSAL